MIHRVATIMFAAVLLAGAVSWAAVDPVTLEHIPDGEMSSRGKAEVLAQRALTKEEVKHVEDVRKARALYVNHLGTLRDYYKEIANAEGLRMVDAELDHVMKARQFVYINWEDKLARLSVTEANPEADNLLKKADKLRGAFNPFNRERRLRDAAALYQQILEEYPKSTAVDSACFGLGEVYATSTFGEYRRAVKFFEMAYLSNPETKHDALFRAAKVCDSDLTDYGNAAKYYWMASKLGQTAFSRQFAATRLKQLQSEGFGVEYKGKREE